MSPQITERTLDPRLQRGITLKVEGRYDEAEAEVRSLLEAEPDNAPARRELGLILNFTGLFDESIEELKRSVELDANYLDARCDLALAYSMLGFMDEARNELEIVLDREPTHPVALRHIVYFR